MVGAIAAASGPAADHAATAVDRRLTGNSGTKYYYAHLSRWEGSSRTVAQGEVIGYNGSTGNAQASSFQAVTEGRQ